MSSVRGMQKFTQGIWNCRLDSILTNVPVAFILEKFLITFRNECELLCKVLESVKKEAGSDEMVVCALFLLLKKPEAFPFIYLPEGVECKLF